jgi:hypothetical protein
MKYAVKMGSSAVLYIPGFVKISSAIQMLIGRYTDRQHGDRISLHLFFFFQNKESRLKTRVAGCEPQVCRSWRLSRRSRTVSTRD